MGFLVARTYYNINVKLAVLTLAGALLDALLTSGFASMALALSGSTGQAITKIEKTTGEYCCLVHAIQVAGKKKNVSPSSVGKIIQGKSCHFLDLKCRHLQRKKCNAKVADIDAIFESLKGKGALEKTEGHWSVPL